MAMNKTSGGDSPLWQVARRASRPSQSRVDDGGGSRCVSRKLIGSLGFSRRGVFIGEGASSEVDRGALTRRGCGQGLGRAALVCGALFRSLEASRKNKTLGTCFVQFREYFLYITSKTQK
jgi:hypothetical protein